MKYEKGSTVRAAVRIYETLPDGRQHLIARPGDIGHIIYIANNGAPLVQFSGGAIDCDDFELAEAIHAAR